MAMEEKIRLSKLMAEQGLCSRREADTYIERGWVSVDGVVVSELGTRILPTQKITLARAAQAKQQDRVTIMINKPMGYVSAQPEGDYKSAASLIHAHTHWAGDTSEREFSPAHLMGLAPAGRLDIDSTGLLVLTQDGRIARQLVGDDSDVEKEYLVRVRGQMRDRGLQLLNHGLSLDDKPLKPARVVWQNQDQLRFVLREGRKRQIRRMCELVGLEVTGLKRVRIGRVTLGDLPGGQWRYMKPEEKF
jgi:23S rRNA pseudouridine2604 synthase